MAATKLKLSMLDASSGTDGQVIGVSGGTLMFLDRPSSDVGEVVSTISIVGGVLTVDVSTDNAVYRVPLDQNITSVVFENWPVSGEVRAFVLEFVVGGSYAIAWPPLRHWFRLFKSCDWWRLCGPRVTRA